MPIDLSKTEENDETTKIVQTVETVPQKKRDYKPSIATAIGVGSFGAGYLAYEAFVHYPVGSFLATGIGLFAVGLYNEKDNNTGKFKNDTNACLQLGGLALTYCTLMYNYTEVVFGITAGAIALGVSAGVAAKISKAAYKKLDPCESSKDKLKTINDCILVAGVIGGAIVGGVMGYHKAQEKENKKSASENVMLETNKSAFIPMSEPKRFKEAGIEMAKALPKATTWADGLISKNKNSNFAPA